MPAPDLPLTVFEARALLGLAFDAGPGAAKDAFRAAAKLAHPDRPGGDAARFRQIVAAYRVLQAAPSLPALAPAPEAVVEIDPIAALTGGEAEAVFANGGRVRVRLPAGARDGERLRLAGLAAVVRIAATDQVQARGSDLWVTAAAPALALEQGGRAMLRTPLGERAVWISRAAARRALVRLEGEGLPARGGHPAGDLFIRLVPEAGAPEGPARARLRAFAAAWAA